MQCYSRAEEKLIGEYKEGKKTFLFSSPSGVGMWHFGCVTGCHVAPLRYMGVSSGSSAKTGPFALGSEFVHGCRQTLGLCWDKAALRLEWPNTRT
jgi:hypothetical protein